MVFQKKGMSFCLLPSTVGSQYNCFSNAVSATKRRSLINPESAPVNTSCHRKPSVVMMKIFCVEESDWASTNVEASIRAYRITNFILLGLSKIVSVYKPNINQTSIYC